MGYNGRMAGLWNEEEKKRGEMIVEMLSEHYPENISFLPVISPFRFLVTVMLSASTTDRQAEAAAESLFSVFPDPSAIASACEDDIERLIHSAGLSRSKARNIRSVAAYVERNGIPEDEKELVSLPGVGEKTAACYLVSVLHRPGVIADTHFVRVASRLELSDTNDRIRCAHQIKERFPESVWARLSMTANLHGRTVCAPKPRCQECFLSGLCRFHGKAEGTALHDSV